MTNEQKLQKAGICIVTSEFDAYSMRLLCWVTEHGKRMLEDYFKAKLILEPGEQPNTYAIMLDADFLFDKFVPYLYLKEGGEFVARPTSNGLGFRTNKDWMSLSKHEFEEKKCLWENLLISYRVYEGRTGSEFNRRRYG